MTFNVLIYVGDFTAQDLQSALFPSPKLYFSGGDFWGSEGWVTVLFSPTVVL